MEYSGELYKTTKVTENNVLRNNEKQLERVAENGSWEKAMKKLSLKESEDMVGGKSLSMHSGMEKPTPPPP